VRPLRTATGTLAAFGLAGLVLASGLAGQDESDLGPANRGKPPVRTATEALTGVRGIGLPVPEALNEGKPSPELLQAALAAHLPNLGAPKRRRRSFAWFFLGGAVSDFSRLQATGCDQVGLARCRTDRTGLGPTLGIRVRPFGRVPIGLGLDGGRAAVSIAQTFTGPPFPDTSTIDLVVWTATAHLDALIPLGERTRLTASVGWVWSWNRATVTSVFGDETLVEHRRSDGGRAMLGAGIERDLSGRITARTDLRYVDGAAGDADRHVRLAILLGYRVSR